MLAPSIENKLVKQKVHRSLKTLGSHSRICEILQYVFVAEPVEHLIQELQRRDETRGTLFDLQSVGELNLFNSCTWALCAIVRGGRDRESLLWTLSSYIASKEPELGEGTTAKFHNECCKLSIWHHNVIRGLRHSDSTHTGGRGLQTNKQQKQQILRSWQSNVSRYCIPLLQRQGLL